MNQPRQNEYNPVYYRLIALWVTCEAFAGGIMHALKVPFSGLVVSSLAVTCIILIGWNFPSGSSIVKATIIVAIFKLALSPHSPPTAYIAVFFQGLLGEVLLRNRRFFVGASVALAVLALVESALQRLLVLVVVYGNGLWKAVNLFVQKLTKEENPTNYSLMLAIVYVTIHAVVGIFVGLYAARLARNAASWPVQYPALLLENEDKPINNGEARTKRKGKIKLLFLLLWILLLGLFIQGWADPGNAIIPPNLVLGIVARAFLVILTWYLILAPLLMLILRKMLRARENRYQHEIREVHLLVPRIKTIFTKSFTLSASETGWRRARFFMRILLVNVLAGKQ